MRGFAMTTAEKVQTPYTLRAAVEAYALRSRELSEAVARMGRYTDTDPEFLKALGKAKEAHSLCDSAAFELERYLAR